MTLQPGRRLGRYEVIAPLGAGGMGEVYRARDTSIGREVALKVLPADFETNADRRERFRQEAVAAGALNHPNVLVVHDVGREAGQPFLVTELLHGKTLRELLRKGPLPMAPALGYAAAVLDGLAAAHERGIVHRDLKPENIFITEDGVPKILDFGIARLPEALLRLDGTSVTSPATLPGMVLGSAGYMAPEQITGETVDHRADLFSIGVVLFEILVGRPPFEGASLIEVLNAIIATDVAVPLADRSLRTVIERSLGKSPARRFQNASDFAFALRLLRDQGPSAGGGRGSEASRPAPLATVAEIKYQRLTFQPGCVWSARFVPNSDTVVYAAAWSAEANRLYTIRPGFPASIDLQLPSADLLGVSPGGELALLLGQRWLQGTEPSAGMLAQATSGSMPRELAENVAAADWMPGGTELAVVRDLGRVRSLEFPLGRCVYETAGWIGTIRVSHDGTRVAFLDRPRRTDDRGDVVIADGEGRLSRVLRDVDGGGLAWAADDGELWASVANQLVAVTGDGGQRLVHRDSHPLLLLDLADGRALIRIDQKRIGISALLAGDTAERDLTWFDYSVGRDLAPDGKQLLFFEAGDVGNVEYLTGLWRAGDRAPIRIGAGNATSLSADRKWAVAPVLSRRSGLRFLPTGAGVTREVEIAGLNDVHWATWMPDGRHLIVSAHEEAAGARLYLVDVDGVVIRPIGPEGTLYHWNGVSPDGSRVIAQNPERQIAAYQLDGNAASVVPDTTGDDRPIGWTADGTEVFVVTAGIPSRVSRVNATTGARTPWRDLLPADPAGVVRIAPVLVTPDGTAYAYTYGRYLSTLYLVTGLR
jgi:serine/threonine protein kinase